MKTTPLGYSLASPSTPTPPALPGVAAEKRRQPPAATPGRAGESVEGEARL